MSIRKMRRVSIVLKPTVASGNASDGSYVRSTASEAARVFMTWPKGTAAAPPPPRLDTARSAVEAGLLRESM